MPRSEISFGVGCFNFRWHPQPPFEVDQDEYNELVTEYIQSLSSVSNVSVNKYEHETYTFDSEEIPSLAKGDGAFPSFFGLELSFDLYIPFRVQKELSRSNIDEYTCSESFRVHLHHTFFDHVAYIRPLEPSSRSDGPDCAKVVVEYLAEELPKSEDNLSFETLGPTPFHGKFHLFPSDPEEDMGEEFRGRVKHVRGYDVVSIEYNADVFDSPEDAFSRLRRFLDSEAGLFYRISSARVKTLNEWGKLENDLSNLTDAVRGKEPVARWKELLFGGKELQDLRLELVDFQVEEIGRRNWIVRHKEKVYESEDPELIKDFVENAMADHPEPPVETVISLVRFLEEQRSKAIEWLVILVAALVGGVAGSGLTLLLQ